MVEMTAMQRQAGRPRRHLRSSSSDQDILGDASQRDKQTNYNMESNGLHTSRQADSAFLNDDWRVNRRPRRATTGYAKSPAAAPFPSREPVADHTQRPSRHGLHVDTSVTDRFGSCRYRASPIDSVLIHSAPAREKQTAPVRVVSSESDSSWEMMPATVEVKSGSLQKTRDAGRSTVTRRNIPLFRLRHTSSMHSSSSDNECPSTLSPALFIELRQIGGHTAPFRPRPWGPDDLAVLESATSSVHSSEENVDTGYSSVSQGTSQTRTSRARLPDESNQDSKGDEVANEQARFSALIERLQKSASKKRNSPTGSVIEIRPPHLAAGPCSSGSYQLHISRPKTPAVLSASMTASNEAKLNPKAPEFRGSLLSAPEPLVSQPFQYPQRPFQPPWGVDGESLQSFPDPNVTNDQARHIVPSYEVFNETQAAYNPSGLFVPVVPQDESQIT
ncbi:uncharacterized protein B0I36DRAFT_414464 [Microdochium trichocladiopsis]|uniref:Uncharacterized protein n=1 Tax=Microdochium trichocladiopsis TaxID=1682393 RepID=A0A9P8Y090_9PEZI|nr:uncharacterized protein B0I36DRAFT_414464 [Microdochium trichocladiopsis]KAH7026121.1 hypothetical protein B0I36DRAFT_414464 [Microdochium trichocladiopsis]